MVSTNPKKVSKSVFNTVIIPPSFYSASAPNNTTFALTSFMKIKQEELKGVKVLPERG